MTGWLAPGVVFGLCLLVLPVVLAVVWVVRLAWSDDWIDDGNRRPRRWGK